MNDVHLTDIRLPERVWSLWHPFVGSLRLLCITALFALICGLPGSIEAVLSALALFTV